MYILLWEYHVKSNRVAEFETTYNSNGAWAGLFKQHPGYLGTELLRDAADIQRYVTIDRWMSAEAYNSFQAEWQDEYKKLDARCEDLTDSESFLGTLLLL